jgi:hypothetical protein
VSIAGGRYSETADPGRTGPDLATPGEPLGALVERVECDFPENRDRARVQDQEVRMPHVVLLGDSVFDNAAYVAGGPDVVTQLSAALPPGWSATLGAIDGAVARDVERQLARVPHTATHLVVSAGGNDALGHTDILERRAGSVAEVLDLLADIGASFEDRYRKMLRRVLELDLPTTVCTIYNGRLPDPAVQRRASTALTVFNDAILRSAFEAGVGVVDLRRVCSEPADYANPIEPSVQGGAKIARAVVSAVTARRSPPPRSTVFL